jgi:serine/threonine protein kinase
MSTSKVNAFEPLEIIGKGSFGIIRKVRRKSDGKILARKEIDYRAMSDREKRQLVAEVNILRELNHPHIVKYHERYVDKQTGVVCGPFILTLLDLYHHGILQWWRSGKYNQTMQNRVKVYTRTGRLELPCSASISPQ